MSKLKFGKITCVPSFHNRIHFAIEVRKAFQTLLPDVVAIELPDIYYSDVLQAVGRLPRLSVLGLKEPGDTLSYIPIFPSDAMIEGVRLAKTNALPLAFVDLAVEKYNISLASFTSPDDFAVEHVGLEAFYETVAPLLPASQNPEADARREAHMAARLNQLTQKFDRVLFVCGMQHWEPIKALLKEGHSEFYTHDMKDVKSPFLAKLAPKARPHLLDDIPYLVMHYEISRRFGIKFERLKRIKQLLIESKDAPAIKDEGYSSRELQNVLTYAMKLAHIDGRIGPDVYSLLLAAKQTLGDDYAIEVMERALAYPYEDTEDLPEIDFHPDENGFFMEGRKITLKRQLPTLLDQSGGRDWVDLKIVRKKQEEISEGFSPLWFFLGGFYSHVPEDLVLEGFIDRLGDKLASDQQQTATKIEEFSGSMLDGIDMRETIRHHHLGKIYVREEKEQRITLGAWVIIFDEALSEVEYPWMMSLSAEHHNESDIAFYASNPAMHPVTQEIIRGQYGALLAFKPALPVEDKVLWEDLDVDEDLRQEQLLRLAIRLSPQEGVLYLADAPPDPYYFKMAETHGKVLFHLPLSRISQRHLKRLQRFHLLSRKEIRKIADDYI